MNREDDNFFSDDHQRLALKYKGQKLWRMILAEKLICRQCKNTDSRKMRFFWDKEKGTVAIGCRKCAHGADYTPSAFELEKFKAGVNTYRRESHSNWREQNKDKMPPEILDEMSSNYALDA